ncbi:hypothetical protein JCM24511_07248 [Saitozyma sp. JCM 24511]|nr:hypothetical protein JCM24511_07248 [Saitozyma sp. JCM 24511]
MSSSDWWSPSGSTFQTPTRPSLPSSNSPFGQPPSGSISTPSFSAFGPSGSTGGNNGFGNSGANVGTTSRARFAGDELDPEDIKMAEGIKFLPSFASSPAGKLALGTSPSAGGTASPPARRSPTSRFSMGGAESAASPRDARRKTVTQFVDEDMPPTASLRDVSDTPSRVPTVTSALELPPPPSLLPTSSTTSLHVFGPPLNFLPHLEPYLSSIGPLVSYRPGPEGSNWWIVTYQTPTAAAYALRRHGEIVNGRWMLGFKVAGPGSTAGCTLVDGVGNGVGAGNGNGIGIGSGNGNVGIGNGSGSGSGWGTGNAGGGGSGVDERTGVISVAGAGTPMRVQSAPIIRQKTGGAGRNDDYAWEEQPTQGVTNRLAEWLFGR